ncbi:MAG: hypothetical protein WAU44_18010 [Nitrospira sp.]|uniref:hypothetical protein n=1 Tax=Nitrospira sp. ND1 TaxID=1658518 RepID=UPI0011813D1C|nr:hypothetical protein [Nitrospira sp. ND1]MBK7418448.1 hypothetical protein [Nitrospira sp.]MBK7484973.1 hypothetical protein [Nitrospira sp.]MBK9111228.1 hypothetical protein [Nitrospira sp.]MBK9998109.1 hypothetical protein [Nitrospira sp.]MBP6200357.1 hypothetical protein [Nitrospira sp.]
MKRMLAALGLSIIVAGQLTVEAQGQMAPVSRTSIVERTGLFLMAGDYRRALEACEQAIQERPSAEAYLQLTYVYQAIDAYLEQLSKDESWTAVEQLYLNLAYRHTEDLVDPPGGLARMAKEMIQTSVRQQSDVSAAMAVRLNRVTADRLWQEQAQWRHTHPTEWWRAFPDSWVR